MWFNEDIKSNAVFKEDAEAWNNEEKTYAKMKTEKATDLFPNLFMYANHIEILDISFYLSYVIHSTLVISDVVIMVLLLIKITSCKYSNGNQNLHRKYILTPS